MATIIKERFHPNLKVLRVEVVREKVSSIVMFFALLFAAVAVAQSSSSSMPTSSSTAFDSGVPTDAPVPGLYNGTWRPQIHFSPPKGFMNDPNGCFVDNNGTYHLYYQCEFSTTLSDLFF
jgi:beta-fructofuranosidase